MPAKLTYSKYLNRKISIGKKAFLAGEYNIDSIMLEVANTYQPIEGVFSAKYFSIVKAITAYNDAFRVLYKKGNLYGAMAMNRILMEHLIYLYADYLYPMQDIINKVYNGNKMLNQITYKGEKIKPSEVRSKLFDRYKWSKEVWESYNLYIHPSANTGSFELSTEPLEGDTRGAKLLSINSVEYLSMSKALSDAVKVNNAIIYTFRDIRNNRIKYLRSRGLIKDYIKSYYDIRGGKRKSQSK